MQLDAFVHGLFDFLLVGGHHFAAAAIDDRDFLGTQPHGGPGGVDRRIAAADHDDSLADLDRSAQVVGAQEIEGVGDAFGLFAGDAQVHSDGRANAEEHRFAAFRPQGLQREIAAQLHIGQDLDAHVLDHADLAGDDFAGQPIGRDRLHQHAAGPRFGLVDLGLVAQPGEEVGARQSRRPGADDGDLAARVLRVLADLRQLDRDFLIDHEPLDAADRHRLVQRRAAALVLAGVEAHARADRGERIAFAMQPQRLRTAVLRHQRDVAGNIHVGRTGARARRVDQSRTHARMAMPVADVLDVLVAEMADRRQHGVRGRLAQTAQRRLLDPLAQLDQAFHVGLFALARADAFEDLQHPFGAHAAGHALAARFLLHKLEEEPGHVDHAAVLVHHDQAAGAHDRAQFGRATRSPAAPSDAAWECSRQKDRRSAPP